MKRASLAVVTVALVAVLAGCGEVDPTTTAPGDNIGNVDTSEATAPVAPPEPSAPPGQLDVEGTTVPEEQLASIDEESSVVEERTVRRFAFLLDRLQQRCDAGRSQLADFTVNTRQQLDEQKGVQRSNQEILEDVVPASQAAPGGRCIDLFTLYLSTTGEP